MFTKLSVSGVTYVCSNNGLATLSHRQNGVTEEPLRNSVAFCNNPNPKDLKCLGTSFCQCKNLAKMLFEPTEVSTDTHNFINMSSRPFIRCYSFTDRILPSNEK